MKPHVYHVNLKACGYWAALVDHHPLIVSILGADLYDDARWDYAQHRLAVHLFRRAVLVTGDTPHAREVLEGWACPGARYHEIHWGVDLDLFHARATPAPCLARLPRPLFLSNRSAVPNSCLDVLLRAFARVRRRRRCSLVLGGRVTLPETIDELQSLIRAWKIPDVHMIADLPHEEMPGIYAAADAFVSIPYSDGTSVSVVEAMASGRPLILSDIPANRALIERGAAGLLTPVMDTAAVTAAMQRFIASPRLRQSMGRVNRRAAGAYDARRAMDRMARLYDRVIAATRRTTCR